MHDFASQMKKKTVIANFIPFVLIDLEDPVGQYLLKKPNFIFLLKEILFLEKPFRLFSEV